MEIEMKKILTRGQEPTDELTVVVNEKHHGLDLEYTEVYYLDNEVDEESGMITENLVPHYTRDQMDRNLKALKSAYDIAKLNQNKDERRSNIQK